MTPKCQATTKKGRPCKAWGVEGSTPPLCSAHGGGKAPVGAPKGNTNAIKHGYYMPPDPPPTTITDIINDLATKQQKLSQLIEDALTREELNIATIADLLSLHGQNASRLGRLLRDKRALTGDAADGIAGAIAQALNELSTELGTEL